jgi:hypothetical protein
MKSHARNANLQCCWRSWEVVKNTTLRLNLPKYNIPDMSGTIQIAEVLMPDVCEIRVYCASVLDSWYIKENEEWKAYQP